MKLHSLPFCQQFHGDSRDHGHRDKRRGSFWQRNGDSSGNHSLEKAWAAMRGTVRRAECYGIGREADGHVLQLHTGDVEYERIVAKTGDEERCVFFVTVDVQSWVGDMDDGP